MAPDINTDKFLFQHENRNFHESPEDFYPPVTSIRRSFYGHIGLDTYVKKIDDEAYDEIAENVVAQTPVLAYGDAWVGMAAHASDMSQLDRQMFEDGFDGSGGIQRPSINVPRESVNLQHYANRIGCSLDQAEDLADFWQIIDPSKRLWPTFLQWTKARSVEGALAYFEHLATELTSDEVNVNESEWNLIDDLPEKITVDNLGSVWNLVTGGKPDNDDEPVTSTIGMPPPFSQIVDEVFEKYSWDGINWDRGFPAPPLLRYVNINNDIGDENSWIDLQPKWYRTLLSNIKNVCDITQLKRIGRAYNGHRFGSFDQGMVFWVHYRIQKKKLEADTAKKAEPVFNAMLTYIRNADHKKVKFIGYRLFEAQKGRYPMKTCLADSQWSTLWSEYNQLKKKMV